MIIAASMGIVVPIGFTLAIANHPKMAGTASTFLGFYTSFFFSIIWIHYSNFI